MQTRWQDWAQLVLGVWLFFSPWILGYANLGAPSANAYVIGAVIVILAAGELFTLQRWEEWINLLLGIWLIIAPWVVGFSPVSSATENSVVLGIIMIVLPLWAMGQTSQQAPR